MVSVPLVIATCRLDDLVAPLGDVAIEISLARDTVAVADSVRVVPAVTVGGERRHNLPTVWTSSDPTVATVDGAGLVRALGRGKSVLSVRIPRSAIVVEDVVAQDTVWVIAQSVRLTPADTVLEAFGDTLCLNVAALDARGNAIAGAAPALEVTVDPDSTIRRVGTTPCMVARANGSPATVEATLDTALVSAELTVRQQVTAVDVTAPGSELTALGATLALEAAARDRNDSTVADAAFAWASRDAAIVDVDATGVVTAKAEGTAYVLAAVDTVSDSVAITVTPPVLVVAPISQADTLRASAGQGTGADQTADFEIRNAQGGGITWDAAVDVPWLTLDATSGTSADTVAATFHPDELEAGTHAGTITVTSTGAAGSPRDLPVRFEITATAPTAPAALTQQKLDGVTDIAEGGTSDEASVVLGATLADPDVGDSVRVDVEVQAIGADFTGEPTHSGNLVARGEATTVTVSDLPDDASYHWRARTRDRSDSVSAWVSFGENADGETDFHKAVPESPTAVTTLKQFEDDGTTEIGPGASASTSTVVLSAVVADPDAGDRLRLEVEVEPVGTDFDAAGTDTGVEVASGNASTVTITIADDQNYHWRARAVDQTGRTGPWVTFGTADINTADFNIPPVLDDPHAPSGLRQFRTDDTPIATGGSIDQIEAKFTATLSDPDAADQLRMEVEVKPTGVAFDFNDTDTSAAVANGAEATVTVTGLAEDTDYHWQVRAIDQTDRAGEWVSYPEPPNANAESATDFRVAVPENPNAPTQLRQFKADGTTTIFEGGTTDQSTVVFQAVISDPDDGDQVRLEIEIDPINTTFNGMDLHTSTLGASGASRTVTVSDQDDNTRYHWRARAVDQTGRTSQWVSFGSNTDPGDTDYRIVVPEPPALPTSLAQLKSDGATAIDPGTSTDEGTVVVEAAISDPDPGDQVRLDVEVRPLGDVFDGTPTNSGVLGAGGTVQVSVPGLSDNTNYRWRARARDQSDSASAWVEFGTEADTDFSVVIPDDPHAPTEADQFKSNGTDPIPGGTTTDEQTVVFKATVSDPDIGDQLRIDVEVKEVTASFDGTTDITTGTTAVASGELASVTVSGLNDDTDYQWRVRARDQLERVGPWVEFGGAGTDFATAIPDDPAAPTALRQFKTDDTALDQGDPTDESSVVFRAAVDDPDLGDQLVLEVEVRETGVAFTDVPTATGVTAVSAGQVASVTQSGLDDDTGFHWQARVKDQTGRAGPWQNFGTNVDPGDADFSTAIPDVPNAPASLQQREDDAVTVIAAGDTTDAVTVVLEAQLSDPDAIDQVGLDLQVIVAGGAFSETPTHQSALVVNGSTVQDTVMLSEDVDYEWRARTRDNTGRTSAWVSFDGSDGVTDFRTSVPEAPDAPADLAQFQIDGTSQISAGGTDTASSVVLKATVTDPDPGDFLKLEAEVKTSGSPFDGSSTQVGSATVSSGGTAEVTFPGLSDNTSYDWRVRAIDRDGQPSGWVTFGTGDNDGDFVTAISDAPNAPTNPLQFESDGTTSIGFGNQTAENTVVLQADVSDPDGTDDLFIDIELEPVDVAFTNAATHVGTDAAVGGTAQITVNGLSDDVSYHWQVRTRDQTGRTSGWTAAGGNSDSPLPADTDFSVDIPGAPNAPTALAQFESDSAASIPDGATTNEDVVVMKATVSDADPSPLLRLEVEAKPVTTAFNGTNLFLSTTEVGDDQTAITRVTGLNDDTDYHWRARTVDQDGNRSGWVEFLGGGTAFAIAIPENPSAPGNLQQREDDATTIIAVGDTTDAVTVVLEGTVTDPDPADQVELQLEVIEAGGAFSGTPTHVSGLVSRGSTPQVTVSGLTEDQNYEWRARTRDDTNLLSAWVSFNGSDGSTDFRTSIPEAPGAPADLAQFQIDGTSQIGAGGTDTASSVVLKATVTDPDPGDFLKLEAEVKPSGSNFDESGTQLGATTVSSGGTAELTFSGLSDNTNYDWRVRTVDRDGVTSAWVSFGAGDNDVDFVTAIPDNPSAPTTLKQFKSNGTEQITAGATTNEQTVIFEGVVSDPDAADMLRLEVEVRPISQSFTGTGTIGTTAVSSGNPARVTVSGLTDDEDYHWRARTRDQDDRVSDWVSFSGSDGTSDFRVAVPENPTAPAALEQLDRLLNTIALGDTVKSDTVVFKGTISDPDEGDVVRLQIEYQPVGTTFTNAERATSSSIAGSGTVTVKVGGIGDDQAYHWQARTIDQTGRTSAWAPFGGNTDPNDVDFRIWKPDLPSAPTGPQQLKSTGSTTIPTGGTTDETTVIIRAGVSDPDEGDSLRLQVELLPIGAAFTNDPTHTGNTAVESGGTAVDTISGLVDNTRYHWQVRAIDELGNTGPWTTFGGNSDSPLPAATDFAVNSIPQDPSPAPTNPKQFQADGTTEITVGGFVGGPLGATVVLKATVFDPDPGDSLVIEVEAKKVGEAFNGENTTVGTARVGANGTAEVSETFSPPLTGEDAYHWRVRTLDQTGRWSEWTSFGGNLETAADFRVDGTL